MRKALIKYNLFLWIATILFLAFPHASFAQYRVSGLIEFTYRDYQTKIGDQKSSEQTFSQHYTANLAAPLWDPRFMTFSAGVGYQVMTSSINPDTTSLDYNVNAAFFPQSKISADAFTRKTKTSIDSMQSLTGYDFTTTAYGGSVYVHPGRLAQGARNSNNNNANDYNGNRMSRIPLPDLSLSYIHSEGQGGSTLSPIDETRDERRGTLYFRPSNAFSLNVNGSIENYKNNSNANTVTAYDSATVTATATLQVSPGGDLNISGRSSQRDTSNISGYARQEIDQQYLATLNFKEVNRLRHYYRYEYDRAMRTGLDLIANKAEAIVSYRITTDLDLRGGLTLDYRIQQTDATAPTPAQESIYESGGATAGASYKKMYTPQFLGPFGFKTEYDFGTGFIRMTQNLNSQSGTGMYYTNRLGLAFESVAWDKDNLSLSYYYRMKRDSSPAQNDEWEHRFFLNVMTRRIPRTVLSANATYFSQEFNSSSQAIILMQMQSNTLQNRGYNYQATINHTLTPELQLDAGASRGTAVTNSTVTLFALESRSTSVDTVVYGDAVFNYAFTRNLRYYATAREEYRSSEFSAGQTSSTRTHELDMKLNCRVRMIFVDLEYRLRQVAPDNALRTTQQLYFVTVSRPF